jgi:hypothetical protein
MFIEGSSDPATMPARGNYHFATSRKEPMHAHKKAGPNGPARVVV